MSATVPGPAGPTPAAGTPAAGTPAAGTPAAADSPVAAGTRLVHAEVMKVRTTRAWWLFIGGFALLVAVTALANWAAHHSELYPPGDLTNETDALALAAADRTPAGAARLAATMITFGQPLLVLAAMLLGVHLVGREYTARTTTATFLVTPRRERVIAAKLVTAALFGVFFWAMATAVAAVLTPVFLAVHHLPTGAAGSPPVVHAAGAGLLAYVLWTLFGLGLGAALRNQTVASVAAIAIYAGGFAAVELVVYLLHGAVHASWLPGLAVAAPAQASNVMITSGRAFPGAPPWWVGALVLAAYATILTGLGITAIRRHDVA